MSKLKLFIFNFLFILIISNNAYALSFSSNTNKVAVQLYTDKNELYQGDDIQILIKLKMLDSWHTYWENPGDSGEKTKIKWTLPKGYKDNIEDYSTPISFETEGIIQYGYDDEAYFLIKLYTTDLVENSSKYDFEARISWLACREECVPEKIKINFSIPVNNVTSVYSIDWSNILSEAKTTFPRQTDWSGYYKLIDNKTLLVNINSTNSDFPRLSRDIKFIPFQEGLIVNDAPQIIGFNGKNSISLLIPLESENFDKLDGILILGKNVYNINLTQNDDLMIYAKYISNNIQNTYGFLWILFLAFCGGLILNLMPCILPILTLKAISIIQGAYNKKESRIEAIMYFIGVVTSFLIIASILLLLRINGEKIGWGFQMQSPIFVVTMIVIFFIIFLMLLDIVTIHNPFSSVGRTSFKHRRINSLFTGLFSVLIASPCTAPFMGIAIGYTLSQPLYIYYPVFLVLGIGYALPFTLIGFFPIVMRKILPKPGKWMIVLKKIFAFPILLTCFWLVWILYNQYNISKTIDSTYDIKWEKYNEAEIEELLNNGEAVFIDFTAKWCITCLINKNIALDTEEFAYIVKNKNIYTYRADWTNHDELVEKALEKYNRNSIPLYIYYPKESNGYVILPQILTPNILNEEINKSPNN